MNQVIPKLIPITAASTKYAHTRWAKLVACGLTQNTAGDLLKEIEPSIRGVYSQETERIEEIKEGSEIVVGIAAAFKIEEDPPILTFEDMLPFGTFFDQARQFINMVEQRQTYTFDEEAYDLSEEEMLLKTAKIVDPLSLI